MSFGGSGGSGGGSVATSSDVALNSLQNDQVLTFDSGNSKWQNKAVTGGGSSANAVLFSLNPATRPTADASNVVLFICATEPTAMKGSDVWLSELGV